MRVFRHGRVLITGGAGFIGSAVVRRLLEGTGAEVLTLDALTYAASPEALGDWLEHPRHQLVAADIRDSASVQTVLQSFRPHAVLHLAAETHVDRSIDGPSRFVETNVVGTTALLAEATRYWRGLGDDDRAGFRFLHVSTDEVFGSLAAAAAPVHGEARYHPRSPYAASKAAADHFVRAWGNTYGLPVMVTHCGNNFGPWQFPEKLLPVVVSRAMAGAPIPLYGSGDQVRDWIHVDDHAEGLITAVGEGTVGATYVFGARNEWTNRDLLGLVCDLLDELVPAATPRRSLITTVPDRPGHDQRYAIDPTATEVELGWRARREFRGSLRETVGWLISHQAWLERKLDGSGGYQRQGLEAGL